MIFVELIPHATNTNGIRFAGSRFALMNIKAIAFYLLLNFNIQPYEETQIPIKFAKAPAVLTPEKGIHLEFKQRL